VLVKPGVVCKAGMETVTGTEAAVGAGLEVAEGIRAAALGISSLPIVRPVTGSWIGSEPCSSHWVTWLTVGKVPNLTW